MLTGAHAIIYSARPDADRDFLRDVLKLPHVDVGHGWLIFGLPPSEIAVHPADKTSSHEIYFMCDDIEAFVAAMKALNVECGSIENQGWGMLSRLTLPGGGTIGVYQPRHARPEPMTVGKPAKAATVRVLRSRKKASRNGKKRPGTVARKVGGRAGFRRKR